MNQRITKRLRKTLLEKAPEVMMLIHSHFGEKTKQIESPQAVWKNFKKLYKMGLVPKTMIIKTQKEKV